MSNNLSVNDRLERLEAQVLALQLESGLTTDVCYICQKAVGSNPVKVTFNNVAGFIGTSSTLTLCRDHEWMTKRPEELRARLEAQE